METCGEVLTFESVEKSPIYGVTILMKTLWQFFCMALFVLQDLQKKKKIWDFLESLLWPLKTTLITYTDFYAWVIPQYLHVQYCVKAMQTKFNEIRSLFSRNLV